MQRMEENKDVDSELCSPEGIESMYHTPFTPFTP